MGIFLAILILIICNGISFAPVDGFNEEYLDRKHTTAVNGIFVILVLFSHYIQYIDPTRPFEEFYVFVMRVYMASTGPFDEPYLLLRAHLDQLVVASFWFYSGFGMMESIRRSGDRYINKIASKAWQLLLRFDIAVIAFWTLYALIGVVFPLKRLLPALIGWISVGNSYWYIFAVLAEYLIMYLAFKAGFAISDDKGRRIGLALTAVLTVIFVFVMMKLDRPAYTYNTMIILPFGACYSEYRKPVEKIIMKNDRSYLVVLTLALGAYVLSFFNRWKYGIEGYTLWALMFTTLLIMFTMKVRIYNPLLEWFGKHIFSIYILQRIPMTILLYFGCIKSHKYISLVIVIVTTMAMALLFEAVTDRIIAAITKRTGKKELIPERGAA